MLKAFGGIGKIKIATPEEIAAVKGIGEKDAKNIYEYFHK